MHHDEEVVSPTLTVSLYVAGSISAASRPVLWRASWTAQPLSREDATTFETDSEAIWLGNQVS